MPEPSDIDDLFKLPLTEFTAARNSLAASLKEAGRADAAAEVKALTKPPLSAWAVNQLYWRHRKPFDQLIAAGERLRDAQASQLAGKGGDMRAPTEARREALAELSTRAAALLRESGHPATPDLTRRIATTLEALATYGRQTEAPAAGRLTADVDPPGFEALSALVPQAKPGKDAGASRVIPFRPPAKATPAKKMTATEKKRVGDQERKVQREAAVAALREAERVLRDARRDVLQSQASLRKAAALAKSTERRKTELEQRLEKAAAAADAARQDARRLASAAEEAAQSVQDAERAVEKAKDALNP